MVPPLKHHKLKPLGSPFQRNIPSSSRENWKKMGWNGPIVISRENDNNNFLTFLAVLPGATQLTQTLSCHWVTFPVIWAVTPFFAVRTEEPWWTFCEFIKNYIPSILGPHNEYAWSGGKWGWNEVWSGEIEPGIKCDHDRGIKCMRLEWSVIMIGENEAGRKCDRGKLSLE